MTKKIINAVQEYLTVVDENKVYQIVNVQLLLKRHPPEAVISFLRELQRDYKKDLRRVIANNKTDSRINDIVAKNFRIKMAINTIKNAKREVSDAA